MCRTSLTPIAKATYREDNHPPVTLLSTLAVRRTQNVYPLQGLWFKTLADLAYQKQSVPPEQLIWCCCRRSLMKPWQKFLTQNKLYLLNEEFVHQFYTGKPRQSLPRAVCISWIRFCVQRKICEETLAEVSYLGQAVSPESEVCTPVPHCETLAELTKDSVYLLNKMLCTVKDLWWNPGRSFLPRTGCISCVRSLYTRSTLGNPGRAYHGQSVSPE